MLLIFTSLDSKRCGLVLPGHPILHSSEDNAASITGVLRVANRQWHHTRKRLQASCYLQKWIQNSFSRFTCQQPVHDEGGTQKACSRAAFEEFHHIFYWATYHTAEQVEWSHGSAPASTSITRSLARPVDTPTAMKPSIFLRCSCQLSLHDSFHKGTRKREVIPSNHWSHFRVKTRWGSQQLPSV